jgi:CheY-like chemotaxis protein/DNA-binding CsgD family transcriptional regulator
MSGEKILIVDDSPTTSDMIKMYLETLDYEVPWMTDSAESAIDLVKEVSPDLVLMDINLGEGMDGIDAADIMMKKHKIPVIYVTAYSDKTTLDRAKDTIPFGFINKPFRMDDLKVNIEIALTRNIITQEERDRNIEEKLYQDHVSRLEFFLLSEAMDHLVSGVVVIDESSNIYYANKAANNIIDSRKQFKHKDGKFEITSRKTRIEFLEKLNKRENMVLTIDTEKIDLNILIFPIDNPSAYNLDAASSFIMFLFDSVCNADKIEEVVRTLYKLSPTEARVASHLVFNPYLTDVAAKMGITYHTARTHLKKIYLKTETNKLPALIQKIITGPAGILIHAKD